MTSAYYHRRPGEDAPRGGKAPKKPPKTEAEREADTERARDMWRYRLPFARSPGDFWFRNDRGLGPDMLLHPDGGDGWPEPVAWSDDVYRLPTPPTGPGILYAVNDAATGLVCAVHRVPFRGGKPIVDANGKTLRISLGEIVGNAFRGGCRPDPAGRWALAEGVETALAFSQLTRIPCWASISAGNMAHIKPPSWARYATIVADNDAKQTGLQAAADALTALRCLPQLESVRVIMADAVGRDANDVLREVAYG
jgi:hypothetical protein